MRAPPSRLIQKGFPRGILHTPIRVQHQTLSVTGSNLWDRSDPGISDLGWGAAVGGLFPGPATPTTTVERIWHT